RALGQEAAQVEDEQAEDRTAAEGDAPAPVGPEQVGIEQRYGDQRAQRRAEPEAAVDRKVGAAAQARGDQFLDRRVYGRVLAADTGAGQEAEEQEALEVPRQRRRRGGDEIDAERDVEQLLAAEAIGEMAEEQRAQHGADQ